MTGWKEILFVGGVRTFDRIAEMSFLHLGAWIEDELAGHGTAVTRDEEGLVEVILAVWPHLSVRQRDDLDLVLARQLRRKVDASLATNAPSEGLRREIHALLDCYLYLPLTIPSDMVQLGMLFPPFAEITRSIQAPHSLREAFARTWAAYTERTFDRLGLQALLPTGDTYAHERLRLAAVAATPPSDPYPGPTSKLRTPSFLIRRAAQHAHECSLCHADRARGVLTLDFAPGCEEGQGIQKALGKAGL